MGSRFKNTYIPRSHVQFLFVSSAKSKKSVLKQLCNFSIYGEEQRNSSSEHLKVFLSKHELFGDDWI